MHEINQLNLSKIIHELKSKSPAKWMGILEHICQLPFPKIAEGYQIRTQSQEVSSIEALNAYLKQPTSLQPPAPPLLPVQF
jgi:hypothetical protein